MQGGFFEYCTLDNPIFIGGMIWMVIFLLTFCKMLSYKSQEAKEANEKAKVERKQEEDLASTNFSKKPATPSRREEPVHTRSATRAQIVKQVEVIKKVEQPVVAQSPAVSEKPKKTKSKKPSGKSTPVPGKVSIPSLNLNFQNSVELSNKDIDDGWEVQSSRREK